MKQAYILICGNSSKHNQAIARIVRQNKVYCEVQGKDKIDYENAAGIIAVYDDPYKIDPNIVAKSKEMSIPFIQINNDLNDENKINSEIKNFIFDICKCKADWSMDKFAEISVDKIKKQVGDGRVLLALSGGVDSSVVAALISKAVGKNLTCIFVDHGLMRKNEGDEIESHFGNNSLEFIRVNAQNRFLARLKGVTDPETKRKIIGEEFIRVFEEEAKKIGQVDFLAQGTIYPDIIESGTSDGDVVKSHHNVGGLPENVDFKTLIEPVDMLFKDEVRQLGKALDLPDHLLTRQPFPGPGLGIRVIGEITKEKLDLLRDADFIFRDEILKAGLNSEINQYFAILTPVQSVGVTDGKRTYGYTLALRGVVTSDFMEAQFAHIPYEILGKVSQRICAEVPGINRIVYDVTSKPPATIEWE